MTQCLEDKALFLLSEGEANEAQQSHLQSCQTCAQRYYEIKRDLRLITHTLRQEPPPLSWIPKTPILYRSLPIAAGVLLVLALLLDDKQLWRAKFPSDQALNSDVSQFLEQVSEAVFDGGRIRDIENTSSESDLASLQVALGESCSEECRGLLNNSNESFATNTKAKTKTVDQPVVTVKKRPVDPTMQRMVADR
jgi:hypothetical protein